MVFNEMLKHRYFATVVSYPLVIWPVTWNDCSSFSSRFQCRANIVNRENNLFGTKRWLFPVFVSKQKDDFFSLRLKFREVFEMLILQIFNKQNWAKKTVITKIGPGELFLLKISGWLVYTLYFILGSHTGRCQENSNPQAGKSFNFCVGDSRKITWVWNLSWHQSSQC